MALRHHLVTRYTSLVAVDRTPAVAPGTEPRRAAVPTNLPAGWHAVSNGRLVSSTESSEDGGSTVEVWETDDALSRSFAAGPFRVISKSLNGKSVSLYLLSPQDHESLVRTPIILATAKAGPEAIKQGLEVGADDYVTKPFDIRELIARIEAHLRVRRLDDGKGTVD